MTNVTLIVLGALMAMPLGIVIGTRHERLRADKQRRYLRRVTGVRSTVARPGTNIATVRTASLSRSTTVSGTTATPRK